MEQTAREQFKRSVTVAIDRAGELDLADFQEEAVREMQRHYNTEQYIEKLGYWPGMVVMPTGSGKTRTSVSWLMHDPIKQGYKILWLCHRQELLTQAANTMCYSAGRARGGPKDKLVIRCVSSAHSHSNSASFYSDDIMVFSIQSLSHKKNMRKLEFYLKSVDAKRLLVVIDEAHHSPAASYQKVLKEIGKIRPGFKLLGLTATPTRMTESERKALKNIFGNMDPVYSVSMGYLIRRGFLATPNFERIRTEIDMESELEENTLRLIETKRDLPPELCEEIARNPKRNQIIVNQYLKKRDVYKKTLVFAINQVHCNTLKEEFERNGVSCDFVMSGRRDNAQVLDSFRRGDFDVLINIEIVTEGIDVPGIQTVFLTRPTSSDVLLMQMIGRGLRGPDAGGTEQTYIVDFHDKWERFEFWLDPEFIIEGEQVELDETTPAVASKPEYFTFPWELVTELYNHISNPADVDISMETILAIGWYIVPILAQEYENETEDLQVFVYAHQVESYQEMGSNIDWFLRRSRNYRDVINEFFHDIAGPMPKEGAIEAILQYISSEGRMPEFFTFEERDKLNPKIVAEFIREKDMTESAQFDYMRELYNSRSALKHIFRSFESFEKAVFKEKQLLRGGRIPIDRLAIENPALLDLAAGPYHNLDDLYDQVIIEQFNGKANRINSITWSRKPVKTYFGYYNPNEGQHRIVINCILDSPDVSTDVLKYLIYHEQLHANGMIWHDDTFYAEEAKYPNSFALDNFFDTMHEKFDMQWNSKSRTNTNSKNNIQPVNMMVDSGFKRDKNELKVLLDKANEHFGKDEFLKTIELMDQALQSVGPVADAYVLRGWAHEEIKQHKEAMDDFQNALKLDDKCVDALMGRAEEFINRNQFENALTDLETLLVIDPEHIKAINNLGWVHEKLGNINEAMRLYERALELQPNMQSAKKNRARLIKKMSKA